MTEPTLEDRLSTGTWRLFVILGAALALVLFAVTKIGVFAGLAPAGEPGSMMPNDFSAFYAAASLALSAGPLAPLDQSILEGALLYRAEDYAAHGGSVYMAFLYPPALLAALLPFASLGYVGGFAALSALSVAVVALAARAMAPEGRGALYAGLALLSPGCLLVLNTGQITALWAGGLVLALVSLRDGRETRAGLLIGLLTLKPTLGPLVALALVAGGHRRAVIAAGASALAIAALSTAWAGLDYWGAWLARLDDHAARFANATDASVATMLSYRVALSPLGDAVATAGHWALAAAVATAVGWLWWRRAAFGLRAGALMLAIPLVTPYAWHHEALVSTFGALFLLSAGLGRRLAGRALLIAAWGVVALAPAVREIVPIACLFAPVMTAAIAMACLAALPAASARTHARTASPA